MALEVTTVAQGCDVDIDLMDLVVSRPRFLAVNRPRTGAQMERMSNMMMWIYKPATQRGNAGHEMAMTHQDHGSGGDCGRRVTKGAPDMKYRPSHCPEYGVRTQRRWPLLFPTDRRDARG